MLVVDGQVHLSRVAELVVYGYAPSDDRILRQVDGVGEGIIGVQVFDAQAAVEHVGVSFHVQRLERTVEVDIPEAAPLHVLGYILDKGMQESEIDIVCPEEEREAGVLADGIDVAADVGPGRVVLINAS